MKIWKILLFSLAVVIISGCSPKNSTPEEALNSLLEAKADQKIDKFMSLVSKKSLTEQNISVDALKPEIDKTFQSLKASDFKLVSLNITKVIPISDSIVMVIADIRYKTSDKQEVQVNQNTATVLWKDTDGWKLSINDYIKTINYNNKCNSKNNIEVCVNQMQYYASEIILNGSVRNNNSNNYAFGFARKSQIGLFFPSEKPAMDDYPQLGSSVSNTIPSGSQNVSFEFGGKSGYMVLKQDPTSFVVNHIISMNGELPSGFDNGIDIKVELK